MQRRLPGKRADEAAAEWALRAEAALEELRAVVQNCIEWDAGTSMLNLLDPRLVVGEDAMIKCIEPFIGSGKSLRELVSRWGLIAVLARDMWPNQIPTDKVAREVCPVAVHARSVTRWRSKLVKLEEDDIEAAKQAAVVEVNGFFNSSFDASLTLDSSLPTGGSGSNSPPGTGGTGGNGDSGGSDSGGSDSSTNTPRASASGGDDSDGSPATAEALQEGDLEERFLEGALPELEEADSGAQDPPGTSGESRADESLAALPRHTPQSVHALPRTEDLEAPGLLEPSALLETDEVCQLIEQEVESPHSPDATPIDGGARSAGSPSQPSSATAMGATPASALMLPAASAPAASAPAASAPAASAPAAPTAVEPAASSERGVSCHCGLPCVTCTAGRTVLRIFFRCPVRREEGGCMFYRRKYNSTANDSTASYDGPWCDGTASYDGPCCKRPDCVCTASYNGNDDEYCCSTCRGSWCEMTRSYVGGKPCAVPRFEHGPCYHPEPFPKEVNATRKGSRQTESGPRKGRRQDDADD